MKADSRGKNIFKVHKRFVLLSLIGSMLLGVVTSTALVLAQELIIPDVEAEVVLNIGDENAVRKQQLEVTRVVDVPIPYEVIKEEVINPFNLKEIGTYTLTAYCPCKICCEQYAAPPLNKTGAIGAGVYEGVTVAVDPKKIPYGTKLYIEGLGVRIAADCGGAIKGNKIDVYYETHKEALSSGLGHTARKIYIIEDGR